MSNSINPSSFEEAPEVIVADIIDHVRTKGMWIGTMVPQDIDNLYGIFKVHEYFGNSKNLRFKVEDAHLDHKVIMIEIKERHTPGTFKCFDEIIVNATDQAMSTKAVKNIEITYDTADGIFSVMNDGPSIPVKVNRLYTMQMGNKRDIYEPEIIVSVPLSGTNIIKKEDCIKGGTNGLGAKLPNVNSDWYEIEVNDTYNKKYFFQCFSDELRERDEPVIEVNRTPESYTKIAFQLRYSKFGYKMDEIADTDGTVNKKLPKETAYNIAAWIRYRAYQAAAYVGEGTNVYFSCNGDRELCFTNSPALFATLSHSRIKPEHYENIISYECKLLSKHLKYKNHPINVVLTILPEYSSRAKVTDSIIINGVIALNGNLLSRIKNIITKQCEPSYKKKKKAELTSDIMFKNVRFTLIGCVPGLDWGSQSKENERTDAAIVETYEFTAKELKNLEGLLLDNVLGGADSKKKHTMKNKKYVTPNSGIKGIANKKLIIAEGDSAINFVKTGLTGDKKKKVSPGGPSREWCGWISLQGVMPNSEKMVKDHVASNGDTIKVKSAALIDNDRYNDLMKAIGLDYKEHYYTKESLNKLNYSKIILCVDQDVDGIGKIASILLDWFCGFWPELFKHGIIGRFITPLIRVYRKTSTGGRKREDLECEFYYQTEFDIWMRDAGLTEAHIKSRYTVIYYKGLGSHCVKMEIPFMFEEAEFHRSIHTYECDVDEYGIDCFDKMKSYFGKDSAYRKELLSTTVRQLNKDELDYIKTTKMIKIGRVQLDIDTKTFKLEAIRRQIPHAIDGLNPATRKTLMEALSVFEKSSKKNAEIKVFLFSAGVVSNWGYEHGDASINQTVTGMGKTFVGTNLYPLLIGVGSFGDRHGSKAAQARYIWVKRSPITALLFPPADLPLLEYDLEEGERVEPRYMVPVMPLASMEHNSIPSEGWKNVIYGRNEKDVLLLVNAYIDNWTLKGINISMHEIAENLHSSDSTVYETALDRTRSLQFMNFFPLRPSLRGYKMTYDSIRYYNSVLHSFGSYQVISETEVLITELPIKVKTETYMKIFKTKAREAYVNYDLIKDESTPDSIRIRVPLLKPISGDDYGNNVIDKYVDFFDLKESLKSYLNYYGNVGEKDIIEYDELYHAQILYWAHERKNLYVKRISREIILLKAKIAIEEISLDYIDRGSEKNDPIGKYRLNQYNNLEQVDVMLTGEGFKKINTGLLFNPQFAKIDELENLIYDQSIGTFKYLTSIRDSERVKSEIAKRHAKIEILNRELTGYLLLLAERPTPCASLWKSEINDFMIAVEKGIKTNWE